MPVQMDYTSDISYDNGIMSLMIGDTVYVNGEGDYRGKVCYIGEVHFAKGEFVGVSLDHPLGLHDGAHRGRRYFQCLPSHGVFARIGKISRLPLIPATNDSERCGLWREGSPARSSPARFVRESSPFSSSVSSSTSVRSFSKSPSPSPSSNGGSYGLYSAYGGGTKERNWSGSNLKIGDRVIVASSVGETKTGVLRYLGPVEFASGEYAGIELFHPLGKNDGTVRGRYYFACRHPYGLFVPSYKVISSPANKLGNTFGTKDNVHRVLQYSTWLSSRGVRTGLFDEDFY